MLQASLRKCSLKRIRFQSLKQPLLTRQFSTNRYGPSRTVFGKKTSFLLKENSLLKQNSFLNKTVFLKGIDLNIIQNRFFAKQVEEGEEKAKDDELLKEQERFFEEQDKLISAIVDEKFPIEEIVDGEKEQRPDFNEFTAFFDKHHPKKAAERRKKAEGKKDRRHMAIFNEESFEQLKSEDELDKYFEVPIKSLTPEDHVYYDMDSSKINDDITPEEAIAELDKLGFPIQFTEYEMEKYDLIINRWQNEGVNAEELGRLTPTPLLSSNPELNQIMEEEEGFEGEEEMVNAEATGVEETNKEIDEEIADEEKVVGNVRGGNVRGEDARGEDEEDTGEEMEERNSDDHADTSMVEMRPKEYFHLAKACVEGLIQRRVLKPYLKDDDLLLEKSNHNEALSTGFDLLEEQAMYDELEYLAVADDGKPFYYLNEDVKHQMYELFKNNPKEWNLNRIASSYHVHPERVAGIIRLANIEEAIEDQIGQPVFDGFQQHFNILVNAQNSANWDAGIHVKHKNDYPLTLDAEVDENAYVWYSQHLRPFRSRRFEYMPRTPPRGVEVESRELAPPSVSAQEMEYKQQFRDKLGIPGTGSLLIIDKGKVLPYESKPVLFVRPDGSIRTVTWEERVRALNQINHGRKGSNIHRLYDEMRHHWGIADMEAFPIPRYIETRPLDLFEEPPSGEYYFIDSFEEMVHLASGEEDYLTPEAMEYDYLMDLRNDSWDDLGLPENLPSTLGEQLKYKPEFRDFKEEELDKYDIRKLLLHKGEVPTQNDIDPDDESILKKFEIGVEDEFPHELREDFEESETQETL